MGFVEAVKNVLSNYVNFQGRARRSEYWFWFLAVFLASVVGGIIDSMIGTYLFGALIALGTFLPSLAVAVRRLHDSGRSGFWLFLGLVPLVGFIVLIIFYVADSQPGSNKYGANPKGA